MGKAWIRQETKKDPVADAVDRAVTLAKSNPQRTAGAAVAVLFAVLAAVYFVSRYFEIRSEAWAQLAAAESQLRTGQNSLPQLDEVANRYPNAPAADYAAMLKGDMLYFNGKYDDAVKVYGEALPKARKGAQQYLLLDLGLALEAAGKPADAADKLRTFIDQYPDSFLAPEAHLALARALEMQGQKDAARSAFEKVALLYPETQWARLGGEKAKALGGTVPTPSSVPPLLKAPGKK
jgi:TolA-binding protein